MSDKNELLSRSGGVCELCGSDDELDVYQVEPREEQVLLCKKCKSGVEDPKSIDTNHWRCLNEAMWSEVPAVKVLSYRILRSIEDEGWPRDLLDMFYLEDDEKEWAEYFESKDDTPTCLDSNNTVLNSGDSVTIIKDLEVKGAGFTAKRGTVVKNISLTDNPEQIEGRVNGVKIVLLTKFLKKV